MQVTSVTVGLPVADLGRARQWYEAVLERDGPDLEPVEGVVEYDLGAVWLQLVEGEGEGEGEGGRPSGTVLRIGVPDVHAERSRLVAMGVEAGAVVVVDGVIAFFDVEDPDGNALSCYTVPTLP